jgi:putative endonuclease
LDGASIYILRCADSSYYTGVTRRSVDERVSEHALGLNEDCYTFRRRPVTLVHAEHYSRIADAVATERRIKGWSRVKKEAYIRGDYDALVALAKRKWKALVTGWLISGSSFEAASRRLRTRSVDSRAPSSLRSARGCGSKDSTAPIMPLSSAATSR